LGVLLVVGCGKQRRGEKPELQQKHQDVAAASNDLALKLYAQLRTSPGNLVFSPYGATSSLAMLTAGADGQSRKELLAAIAGATQHESDLHKAHGELLRWLSSDDNSGSHQLNVANRLWVQEDTEVLKSFLTTMKESYAAEPGVVDFKGKPATARKTINVWAADQTRGKILEVIGPDTITDETRLVIANAVYFKGAWQQEFNPKRTSDEPFHTSATDKVEAKLMHQYGEFGFAHLDGVRVLRMPYRGDELAMFFILPDEIDGLGAVEKQLDAKTLHRWIDAAAARSVELPVWIPKFKFEVGLDLKPALLGAGITTVFDPQSADLSRIDGIKPTSTSADDRLYVDEVLQRAMIEVNEEGTEAAAVTTTAVAGKEEGPADPPRFRADHPFLFLIRENETGLILFLGRVVDPTK
jgi:serpin B